MHVGYGKSEHKDDKSPLKGHMTRFFLNFDSNHMFVIGVARQIPCADWYRGVQVHAWYTTPKHGLKRKGKSAGMV